ncbi:MAG TPA: putative nucleotidyltransferase substrate binding domain-containing protein, partial [Burkholderiales bacterium]|nr:putative nucleotidyltransferase substrate binding domain-containing protein [Burkholderiales bacterium]
PDRLQDAVAAGRLAETDAQALAGTQALLMDLILRQQLADLGEGRKPGTRVAIKALSRKQARELAGSLRRLDDMLQALQRAIAG